MLPDIIVALPRDVPLPQYRLFQRVRVCREFLDEEETALGTVVGWSFITKEAITDNPKSGFLPSLVIRNPVRPRLPLWQCG